MVNDAVFRVFRSSEEFVECRERGRYLQCLVHGVAHAREKGMRTAAITSGEKAGIVVGRKAETVCLPACRTCGFCRLAKNPLKLFPSFSEFLENLGARHSRESVLPADVVVAVDPDLMALGSGRTHHAFIAATDMRTGEQNAVQERADAVGRDYARTVHFAQKSRPENPFDRAAGVVRAEGEEECGLDSELVEQSKEIGDANARATIGIDIHFNGKERFVHSYFRLPAC